MINCLPEAACVRPSNIDTAKDKRLFLRTYDAITFQWFLVFLLPLVCVGAGCTAIDSKQTSAPRSIYAGAGLGASWLNVDTNNHPLRLDPGLSPAAQLTIGFTAGSQTALELRVADLGDARFTNGQTLGYQVADITGVYQLKRNRWSAFGRLGVGALFNDDYVGDTKVNIVNRYHVVVGGGVAYSLSSQWTVRAELMGHDVDASHGQLSLLYSFGQRTPERIPPVENTTSKVPAADPPAQPEPVVDSVSEQSLTVSPLPKPVADTPAIPQQPLKSESAEPIPLGPAQLNPASAEPTDSTPAEPTDSTPAETLLAPAVHTSSLLLSSRSISGINFEEDSDQINSSARDILDELAQVMNDDPAIRLTIAAHTAASVDATAALYLSRRRALTIVRYLVSQGVIASRLRPEAFGDTRPLDNPSVPRDNERIELIPR